MDQGSYSNDPAPRPPLGLRALDSRMAHPEVIVAESPATRSLRPATSEEGYNDVKLVRTSTADEFFLLENRQLLGWDSYLPGMACLCGISISMQQPGATNRVNQYRTHPRVDIVEGERRYHLHLYFGGLFPRQQ